MTITTSILGPNSKTISIDNDTQSGVISALRDTLIAGGWEAWDQVSATNTVVRSICYDNVKYKYLQLNSTSATTIIVTCWETWNASTHAGTNAAYCYGLNPGWSINFSLVSCNISVFCSSRWAFLTVNNAVGTNTNAGVFEFYRDNPSDLPTSGFPNYFFTTYANLSTDGSDNGVGAGANAYANVLLPSSGISVGGVPRNRYGDVNGYAYLGNALLSLNGVVGGFAISTNGSYISSPGKSIVYGNAVAGAVAATPVFINTLTNNNTLQLGSDAKGKFDYRGRVFGLKMLPVGFGMYGDITSVIVDSNGFTDSSGTAQDHFIFGRIAIPL